MTEFLTPAISPKRQAVLHFSITLRDWIVRSLQAGVSGSKITQALISKQYDPEMASGLVSAFEGILREGGPLPEGQIVIAQTSAPEAAKAQGKPQQRVQRRMPESSVIAAGDRLVRVLSRLSAPMVCLLEDVLSPQECDALIAAARPRLKPSTLVDPKSGENVESEDRTSFGMFFQLCEDELLAKIDERVAALMQMPVENGEGLQVLHYTEGAKSEPHFDFLMPDNALNQASISRSGQRVSTLVIYLNDVEAGGETVFPELGLSVIPRKGHALYFEYCDEQGRLDGGTLHAAAKVLKGEKWVATKWMRQRRFVPAAMGRD